MKVAKGKPFSYRPPTDLEILLEDLSEATGAPKTHYLDEALKNSMPTFIEENSIKLERLYKRRRLEASNSTPLALPSDAAASAALQQVGKEFSLKHEVDAPTAQTSRPTSGDQKRRGARRRPQVHIPK